MKSGFISILGKPNVGKSSLMNALIGEKVSIVSPKAQTTRDRVMGILTTDEYQAVFVDTPGIHTPKSMLGQYMHKAVSSAASDTDAIVIVLDATKRLLDTDFAFIEKYLTRSCPVYVVVNKTDLAGYPAVYPLLKRLSYLTEPDGKRAAVKEILPVSCKTKENIEVLKKFLIGDLPQGECYFPADDLTDKSVRYQICEIVREKALLLLRDEIPHGVGVYIQSMDDRETIAEIQADILIEKDSHKLIVIGTGGEQLRQIGERARIDIERMLGKKVFLKLFVKVRKDWRNKKNILDDIGYNAKKNF